MRVISGTAKGRRLFAPKSHSIRPALDKVKGAIFNILFDVEGLTVCDIFAGTGAVGIEALSRGASFCTFVDSGREATGIIQKNIELCKFEGVTKIFPTRADVAIEYLQKHAQKFDLIFVDPPYQKDLVNPTLEQISAAGLLADGGKIIVEHSPKEPISEISGLALTDTRKYGQTFISFLCHKQ